MKTSTNNNKFLNSNTKKTVSLTPDRRDFSNKQTPNYNTRSSINAFDSLMNASKNS